MGDYYEHAAPRDVVGIEGVSLGVDPLDLSLKLRKARIRRLISKGPAVEIAP